MVKTLSLATSQVASNTSVSDIDLQTNIKKYMLDPATAGKVEKRAKCIFDDDVRASKNGEI